MNIATVIALTFLFAGPEEFAEASVSRYGRILIVGNTETPDRVIWNLVGVRPGQIIKAADIKAARARIQKCGLFQDKPKPSIELLPNAIESTFKDVLIQIEERPANRYLFFFLGHCPDIAIQLVLNFPETSADIMIGACRATLNAIRDVSHMLSFRVVPDPPR